MYICTWRRWLLLWLRDVRRGMAGSDPPDKSDKGSKAFMTPVPVAWCCTLILNCHRHVPFLLTPQFGRTSEMMGSKIRMGGPEMQSTRLRCYHSSRFEVQGMDSALKVLDVATPLTYEDRSQ